MNKIVGIFLCGILIVFCMQVQCVESDIGIEIGLMPENDMVVDSDTEIDLVPENDMVLRADIDTEIASDNTVIDTFAVLKADYDYSAIKVLKQIRGGKKKSICSFIVDHANTVFLLKQTNRPGPTGELIAVRDMFATHIAESHNLPANRVRLIPKNMNLPGKVRKGIAGTLHLCVSGKNLSGKSGLSLQQPISVQLIKDMSQHDDFPRIVALDTFLGNAARRNNTLFYDEATNRFAAIDLESAFKTQLAEVTRSFFKAYLNNKSLVLSKKQFDSLTVYRDTLKMLVKNNSIQDQHGLLDYFLAQVGIARKDKKVAQLIALYKTRIKENHAYCQEVVTILDALLRSYKDKVLDLSDDQESILVINRSARYDLLCNSMKDEYRDKIQCPESTLVDIVNKISAYCIAYQ
jgi:hypothetical protein